MPLTSQLPVNDKSLRALILRLPHAGNGDCSRWGVVLAGNRAARLALGLTFSGLQPRLDAAGQGDELIQATAVMGALRLRQVHGLGRTLQAPQE